MIRVRWPDRSVTEAGSWEDLLGSVRRMAWREWRTELGFRRALARRAQTWAGGRKIALWGTPAEFGRSLAAAGLYEVEEDTCADW